MHYHVDRRGWMSILGLYVDSMQCGVQHMVRAPFEGESPYPLDSKCQKHWVCRLQVSTNHIHIVYLPKLVKSCCDCSCS